ncbi:hypothetical protein PIROE2DRAFT_9981 [Piromyces sp. E2]|nr:hypothetical protein PIROE2DRAFT_9981 [Piromyces sp. E2]|eukprot:OUM63441.1 hypothetical protein PIROE2DRAFT_9981 [Piromyces sp. E2]
MNCKQFLLCIFTLLVVFVSANPIEKRSEAENIAKYWKKACKKVNKLLAFNSIVVNGYCELSDLYLKYAKSKDQYRYLIQLNRGQCKDIDIRPYGYTEICSSSNQRLYGTTLPAIRSFGCYHFYKNDVFNQCCQYYTERVMLHNTYCSGPHKGKSAIANGWTKKEKLLYNLVK